MKQTTVIAVPLHIDLREIVDEKITALLHEECEPMEYALNVLAGSDGRVFCHLAVKVGYDDATPGAEDKIRSALIENLLEAEGVSIGRTEATPGG